MMRLTVVYWFGMPVAWVWLPAPAITEVVYVDFTTRRVTARESF